MLLHKTDIVYNKGEDYKSFSRSKIITKCCKDVLSQSKQKGKLKKR